MYERVPGDNFDSWLYTAEVGPSRNADLYLILKVFLRRVEPTAQAEAADADRRAFPIEAWGNRWEPFRQAFERSVESVWNNRLWLIPDLLWGPHCRAAIPNVKCSLDIQLLGSASGAHLTINCYCPLRGMAPFRSYMGRPANPLNQWYRNRFDPMGRVVVEDATAPPGGGQVVAAHEIGHWLGLSHVVCGTNDSRCYGVTPGQRNDLMGAGNQINGWHAGPWAERLAHHLDITCRRSVRWRAVTDRPVPISLQA